MSGTNQSSRDLREIVSRARHLLLDFDGPICAVYAGTSSRAVADKLRAALQDLPMPAHVLNDDDPLEVFKAATALGRHSAARAQQALVRLEIEAVSTARPTLGADALMATACEGGRGVTIVSNNSGQAISAYLAAHDLSCYVQAVFGRDDPDPAKMKPAPYRVVAAVEALSTPPSECLLLGDSPSDVAAGHAAGVRVIGYANKPGKVAELAEARADFIVQDLEGLKHTMSTR